MKVDKITTEYKSTLTINKDKYMEPFKNGETSFSANKSVEANELLDIHSIQSKIVTTFKVEQTGQEIDGTYLRFIKSLVQEKPQLIIENIVIKEDNSLDMFLKDGNVLSIKNMEKFITPEEAKVLIDQDGIDQPLREFTLKLTNKDNSFILLNGKEIHGELDPFKDGIYKPSTLRLDINGNMNGFLAIDKHEKSIVIYLPLLGFVFLENHVAKKIIYNLPYLLSSFQYNNMAYIINIWEKNKWKISIVLILILLALIKII